MKTMDIVGRRRYPPQEGSRMQSEIGWLYHRWTNDVVSPSDVKKLMYTTLQDSDGGLKKPMYTRMVMTTSAKKDSDGGA